MQFGHWQLEEELWYLAVTIAPFVFGILSPELVNGSWRDIHKKVGCRIYTILSRCLTYSFSSVQRRS